MKWLAVLCAIAGSASAGPYEPSARTAHLAQALAAIRALPDRDAFELELHEATRVKCRPTVRPAATACAIEVARAVCARRGAGCLAAADIVLTNQHAEYDLVPEQTRVRLVRTSSNYHAAVAGELRAMFSLLAAELALAPGGGELPARIDQFCATRAAPRCAPNARACVPHLAWQRCAAGLVWYVTRFP